MLENENDYRDRNIRSNGRNKLRIHFRHTSVLETTWNATENLEPGLLAAFFVVMKSRDASVDEPADQNIQKNDKGHA
jgi:hypothetical protein